MMSMRFNPPPSWPPVPPGWTPPPGWQPDPSWPDPPPGWNLWIEDNAATRIAARIAAGDAQTRAARWTIAGGGAAFLGSLLPFLSSPDPYFYTVNPAPKDSAAFFGVMLAVLGILMLAASHRTRVISGIAAFAVAGLEVLTLGVCILAGIVGADESDSLMGAAHASLSPQIGIFISILGCAAAGIGAMRSFAHPASRIPS